VRITLEQQNNRPVRTADPTRFPRRRAPEAPFDCYTKPYHAPALLHLTYPGG